MSYDLSEKTIEVVFLKNISLKKIESIYTVWYREKINICSNNIEKAITSQCRYDYTSIFIKMLIILKPVT